MGRGLALKDIRQDYHSKEMSMVALWILMNIRMQYRALGIVPG